MSGKQTKKLFFFLFVFLRRLQIFSVANSARTDRTVCTSSSPTLVYSTAQKYSNRRRYNKHRSHLPSFDKKKHGLAKP